jgi:diguanylate cyclase
MIHRVNDMTLHGRRLMRQMLSGPQALAFLPALTLAAFWLGGEVWLILAALGLPLALILSGHGGALPMDPERVSSIGENNMTSLLYALDHALDAAALNGRSTACIMLSVDDLPDTQDRHGLAATQALLKVLTLRLSSALREEDRVIALPKGGFGVVLAPMRHLDLETAIQLSGRLQMAVEEPLSLDATTIYLSCSIGFCLGARNPGTNAAALLDAASTALFDAQQNGPSAIRSYTDRMRRKAGSRSDWADDAAMALNAGQIVPWFQPQISTDTGQITGFEALARWQHPDRGVISPAEFLPLLEQTGQLERLGEVMLYHTLSALRGWDASGLNVPRAAINITMEELHNPKLIDRIRWELDRFDLMPARLAIEVLENVVAAAPEDIVSRNINGLARLGCSIDLDDFGTGHASISSIRRFAVSRIKIDRSFVMKVDRDPEQQRLVNAILTMADKLGLATLAEGVETIAEHAMLAQLGCGHVQGFGIARPMPFEQTLDWIREHDAKLLDAPIIGRSSG